MNNRSSLSKFMWGGSLSLLIGYCGTLSAETLDEKINRLERLILAQQQQIEAQDRRLNEQAKLLNSQSAQVDSLVDFSQEVDLAQTVVEPETDISSSLVTAMDMDFTVHRAKHQPRGRTVKSSEIYLAAASDYHNNQISIADLDFLAESRGGSASSANGSAPTVDAIPDIGGVLTAPGQLVVDASLQYSHSSLNRFTFKGVEILSSFAIGLLEAEDADRDTTVATITGRMGITSRLEAEIKVPFVNRRTEVTALIPGIEDPDGNPISVTDKLSDNGLGDISAALHYQLNRGGNGYPYFIGNLIYKSTTGEGPFEVDRNEAGIETELAMGSGFHSFQPSVTMLYPTDPGVFYANLSYMFNLDDDVNAVIVDATDPDDLIKTGIGNVDPGDSIGLSMGMAYSVNERTSFSLGYKHDFIQKTKTNFFDPDTGADLGISSSSRLNIAAFLLGYTIRLPKDQSINFNFEFGATADSPDVSFSMRMPFLFDL